MPFGPTYPIRWIVPFPSGDAMDNIARTLGEGMSRTLGLIDAKPPVSPILTIVSKVLTVS